MRTRPPREASDYFVRQATDADALAAELATPGERRRYIATFYTSRFWAHPGAFDDPQPAAGRARFAGQRGRRLPHRAVRRRGQAAGQLRWLREHGRRGAPGSSRRASARNERDADAGAVRALGPRHLPRLRQDGGGGVRRATSGRSCCGTAATSCPGRRPHAAGHAARSRCAPTCSRAGNKSPSQRGCTRGTPSAHSGCLDSSQSRRCSWCVTRVPPTRRVHRAEFRGDASPPRWLRPDTRVTTPTPWRA